MATLLQPSNARGLNKNDALAVADLLQPSRVVGKGNSAANRKHRRMVQFILEFDECTGLPVAECVEIIDAILKDNPALFEDRDHLNFHVQKKRDPEDPNYYRIGLMTNTAGTEVVGLHGDGIIKYSNPKFNGDSIWCTSGTPCPHDKNRILRIEDKCCFSVGPWDCDTGFQKSPDECCSMIKSTVPGADLNGNKMKCHTVYPLGSEQFPIDYDRVQIRVDSGGNVLGAPVNE